LEKNTEKAGKMASTDILLLHFEDTFEDIVTLSKKLQASGKRIEIYPSASKLKKQFSYADKLNIPEVVIL
jgi:histidyl-tRNA synthetase